MKRTRPVAIVLIALAIGWWGFRDHRSDDAISDGPDFVSDVLDRRDGVEPATVEPVDLVVEPAVIDLHTTDEEKLHQTATVMLRNSGRTAITIEHISQSCGCTVVAQAVPVVIAPGETLPLRIDVSMPQYGEKTSVVSFYIGARSSPSASVHLELHGRELPVPLVTSIPRSLELSGAVAGEMAEQSFVVITTEYRDAPAWITGWDSTHLDFNVRLEGLQELDTDPKEWIVREYRFVASALVPEQPDAAARATLSPVLTQPAERTIPLLTAAVRRTAAIRAVPQELAFVWTPDLSALDARRIVLRSADAELEWEVSRLTASVEWLDVEILSRRDEGRSSAIISIQPADDIAEQFEATKVVSGIITVETTHPECRTIEIPVTVTARQ